MQTVPVVAGIDRGDSQLPPTIRGKVLFRPGDRCSPVVIARVLRVHRPVLAGPENSGPPPAIEPE
jgi:hypothetical protein